MLEIGILSADNFRCFLLINFPQLSVIVGGSILTLFLFLWIL